MKCDLHVHTWHSGMCTIPFLRHICRECYTPAAELYERLKRRGMGLVTVTDHDSIDAAEELRRFPDFFLSEEVTATLPSGTEAHVGVYDISERHHLDLMERRDDMPRFLAYLEEQNLVYSINHMFSALTGRRRQDDFVFFAENFPAFEVQNGAMLRQANRAARQAAQALGRIGVGGSDSHGILSLGRVWTDVPGARNKQEYFDGLRAGRAQVEGRHGDVFGISRELFTIAGNLFQQNPWSIPLAPLAALIPVAGLVNYGFEATFEKVWRKRWLEGELNKASAECVSEMEVAA